MPVDSLLTSVGCAGMSSLIFRIIFSFGSDSKRDKKLAAVFLLPAMCAVVKLNCSTKSHAFYNSVVVFLFCKIPCHQFAVCHEEKRFE